MNNVRSQYIKDLIEQKDKLDSMMEEATQSTLESLLAEKVNNSLRDLISEGTEDQVSEESLDEEDESLLNDKTDEDKDDENASKSDEEDILLDDESDKDDDIWDSVEDLKNDDDEYDFTGLDKETVLELMKTLTPEDGVTVTFDNGKVSVEDENTEKEYEIDLNSVEEDDEDAVNVIDLELDGDDSEDETEFELELGDEETDSDDDIDFGGDDTEFEITADDDEEELGEAMTVAQNSRSVRGTTKSVATTPDMVGKGRSISRNGERVKGTTEGYTNESVKKLNNILKENNELKSLVPGIMNQLQSSLVVNTSLGNIVKLVTEHTSTNEEKKQIVERFNKCKSVEESNNLYKTINEELNHANRMASNNVNTNIASQINESVTIEKTKKNLNESVVMDESLYKTINFFDRLNKIK